MCNIKVFLFSAFGVHIVFSLNEDFIRPDETSSETLNYGMKALPLDADNSRINMQRKSRYFQYYRVKKLHGKSDAFSEKQNVLSYMRKIPLQKTEKDFATYAEKPTSANIHNETDNRSTNNKGDLKTENGEGEYSPAISHYTQHQLNENIQNEKGNINFSSDNGKNLPEINSFKRMNYYQPAGHEPKRIDNKQKIYIRKNKNFQYFKIVPGLSSKIKPMKKIDSEYNMFINSNTKIPHFSDVHNVSNYKDDDYQTNVHESFDNDNTNVNDQNFVPHNDLRTYEEKNKDDIITQLYDAGIQQNDFYATNINMNSFLKGDKLNNTDQFTRYHGISKNIIYHNERNIRNNSKYGDIQISYQHYTIPVLQKDNRKTTLQTTDALDYKNNQLSPHELGNKKPKFYSFVKDKVISMEKNKKTNFDKSWYQSRFVKEFASDIAKKSNAKEEFGPSTTTTSNEALEKNVNDYHERDPRNTPEDSTTTRESNSHSNVMRNVYWPKKWIPQYQPNKQYFSIYDKSKAVTGKSLS